MDPASRSVVFIFFVLGPLLINRLGFATHHVICVPTPVVPSLLKYRKDHRLHGENVALAMKMKWQSSSHQRFQPVTTRLLTCKGKRGDMSSY
jgi:hypothetical protein